MIEAGWYTVLVASSRIGKRRRAITFEVIDTDDGRRFMQAAADLTKHADISPSGELKVRVSRPDDQRWWNQVWAEVQAGNAMPSKRCGECGAWMWGPKSVASGIGPECAEKPR